MSQPFVVCPLSESWWLEVVYKLRPKTLCRLRQMCKSMDNLVEHHRFKIARHAQYQFNLDIRVQNTGMDFNLRQNLLTLLTKITLLMKLELQCRILCFDRSNSSDEIQKILECITTEQLHVTFRIQISLQQFVSLQSVQTLSKLTAVLHGNNQLDDFSSGSYLNYLKHIPSVEIYFYDDYQHARILAKNILTDIFKANDMEKLTCLKIHFIGTFNCSSLYDELYEVEWIKRPNLDYQLGGLFFAEVNAYFVVVMHYASKDYFRLTQEISISFYEKDLDNLKDVLIRAAGSRDWGDKCFEKIVNRFNYSVNE